MEVEESPQRRRQAVNRSFTRRHRNVAHQRFMDDYFGQNGRMPKYDTGTFRRRFRMYPALFHRILGGVLEADPTFARRRDVVGNYSISPKLKITAALRMLAWGSTADSLDEYFQMAESTALETLRRFHNAIVHVYGPEYLREPTREDLDKLSEKGCSTWISWDDWLH
ncbi:hypothetical protein LINGRAHAP2_LOCUS18009 [Linum grandiflorum]